MTVKSRVVEMVCSGLCAAAEIFVLTLMVICVCPPFGEDCSVSIFRTVEVECTSCAASDRCRRFRGSKVADVGESASETAK